MKILILSVLLLGSMVSSTLAQNPPTGRAKSLEVPAIVADGFATYQKTGNKAAIAAWLKGSPVENDTANRSNAEGLFNTVESLYGKLTGFEAVRVVPLGDAVKRVYVVAEYEKGPVYASFDCYKVQEGWIVPSFNFNTKSPEVFPPALLGGSEN